MDNINYDQEIERQAHPENFDWTEEEKQEATEDMIRSRFE